MKTNYIVIALGIALIIAAQIVFRGNDQWQWIPRIILTVIGFATAGLAWENRKRKKR